jgi:hypothetical protein
MVVMPTACIRAIALAPEVAPVGNCSTARAVEFLGEPAGVTLRAFARARACLEIYRIWASAHDRRVMIADTTAIAGVWHEPSARRRSVCHYGSDRTESDE